MPNIAADDKVPQYFIDELNKTSGGRSLLHLYNYQRERQHIPLNNHMTRQQIRSQRRKAAKLFAKYGEINYEI